MQVSVPKRPNNQPVFGNVTFSDPLAATIFDRRASDYKTGLNDKDLLRCGSMIASLYRKSAKGYEPAKAALTQLVAILQTKIDNFEEITSGIDEIFDSVPAEKRLPSKPSAGITFEVHWNNKLFLAILDLLRDFDLWRVKLVTLKDNGLITDKDYHKTSRKLIAPIRSVIEQTYPLAKSAR